MKDVLCFLMFFVLISFSGLKGKDNLSQVLGNEMDVDFTFDSGEDSLEKKKLKTKYDKIINDVFPGMDVVGFRKAYPGIIPDSISYNTDAYNFHLNLDTLYNGRKTGIDFRVEDNIVTRVTFQFPSQTVSWYKGKKSYEENLVEAEKTFEYCKSTAEIFAKRLGEPTYSRQVNTVKCVDYTLALSETLFKQEWRDQKQDAFISMFYSGEHWYDSLTADTCSPEFRREKIYDAKKSEYHFAHDLNTDGPRPLIDLSMMISGKNENPEFPFLGGVNVNQLNKYIIGFNKSVNHTQGKWYSGTKVGEIDMSTEFEFRNDTLTGVNLGWDTYNHVFNQYPISYRVPDTLTSQFGQALISFEILSKITEKKYGKPTTSDLTDADEIASFNTDGKQKRIRQEWIQKEFTILLELQIYTQMKTTFRSKLRYCMVKRS